MNDVALRGFRGVEADASWAKRPRRPAGVKVVGNGFIIGHFVYAVPPALPSAPVFGATTLPAGWSWRSTLPLLAVCGLPAGDACDDSAINVHGYVEFDEYTSI
eukprot:3224788-Pyramimonas_sp.AAC.1